MSELMKAIKVDNTYVKRIPKTPCEIGDLLSVVNNSYKLDPYTTVYEINSSIGSSVQWSDSASSEEKNVYLNTAKQNIVNIVFGEFKPYFRRIERALWNQDIKEAEELLEGMEHRMFSEE